jgi:hypothetical protein
MDYSEFYNIDGVQNKEIEHIIYLLLDEFKIIITILKLLYIFYLNYWIIINFLFILLLCFKIKQSINNMIHEIEEIKINLGYCLPINNILEDSEILKILKDSEDSEDSKDSKDSENSKDSKDSEFSEYSEESKVDTNDIHDDIIDPSKNKKQKCHHQSSIMNMISTSETDSETETETDSESETNSENISTSESDNINNLFYKVETDDEKPDKDFIPLTHIITVYIGKNGKCFHKNINCIHLNKENKTSVEIDEKFIKHLICKICY